MFVNINLAREKRLNYNEIELLNRLNSVRPSGLQNRDVRDQMGVTKPTATRTAQKLKTKGLVVFRPIPGDARMVEYVITAKGAKVFGQVFSKAA